VTGTCGWRTGLFGCRDVSSSEWGNKKTLVTDPGSPPVGIRHSLVRGCTTNEGSDIISYKKEMCRVAEIPPEIGVEKSQTPYSVKAKRSATADSQKFNYVVLTHFSCVRVLMVVNYG